MADAFHELLSQRISLPGVGRLTRVFREIDCHRGRPDFIALAHGTSRFLKGKGVEAKAAGSLILSFLHSRSPRSLQYLAKHSGLSMRTVQKVTSELLTRRHVLQTETGSLTLNAARRLWEVQVWAFELKIDNPRRALFQAQQFRLFAHHALIVVPPSQIHLYEKYSESMERWGIGLARFDPLGGEFVVERAPRRGDPQSRHHQAYALFQMLNT